MNRLTRAELAELVADEVDGPVAFEVLPAPDDVLVLVEAPAAAAMPAASALRVLATVTRGRTRAIAVMGPIGPDEPEAEEAGGAPAANDRIGRLAVRLNIDRLVVVGEAARAMHLGAQHEGSWGSEAWFVESEAAAYDAVRALLQPGDVVLVRSGGIPGLRRVGERLALGDADDPSREAPAT